MGQPRRPAPDSRAEHEGTSPIGPLFESPSGQQRKGYPSGKEVVPPRKAVGRFRLKHGHLLGGSPAEGLACTAPPLKRVLGRLPCGEAFLSTGSRQSTLPTIIRTPAAGPSGSASPPRGGLRPSTRPRRRPLPRWRRDRSGQVDPDLAGKRDLQKIRRKRHAQRASVGLTRLDKGLGMGLGAAARIRQHLAAEGGFFRATRGCFAALQCSTRSAWVARERPITGA